MVVGLFSSATHYHLIWLWQIKYFICSVYYNLLDGYIPCISIMHATICIPGMYNPIQNYYTKETTVFLGTFHIGTEYSGVGSMGAPGAGVPMNCS